MFLDDQKQSTPGDQLSLFNRQQVRVHYYDENGALHTGILVRRIRKGRRAGCFLVRDPSGRRFIPDKIRNVEILIE
ncbi:MAG TPA: hypothetical protein ENN17_02065 [bacterium]|nr:hypothetical protein [bacterium]